MCFRLIIFLQWLSTGFFFISLISSHSLTLQILFFLFLYKSFCPHSHSFTIWLSSFLQSQLLSQTLSSSSMAPKSRRSSYILHRYFPSHLLEWSGKADSGSSFDLQITTTPFGGCKGQISKFFELFLSFKFSFDLPFQSVFRPINSWVLIWDGFRWKPDTLGGGGTCLGWVLVEKSLEMLKNNLLCLFLRAQIRACVSGLVLAYAACVYTYADLFLHACICSLVYACVGSSFRMRANSKYAGSFLHTHGATQKP